MATLLLPAIGSALAPSIGAALYGTSAVALHGATAIGLQVAGGLIDSLFLFPKIFGQEAPEPPRLGDLGISDTTEGSPQNRPYGRRVRVPLTPIWSSEVREVRDTTHASGKGGTGGEFITYRYFKGVGLQVAGKPLSDVVLILADGTEFYRVNPNVDITSAVIDTQVETVQMFGEATQILVLESPEGGPDLSRLKSGKDATISGYPDSNVLPDLEVNEVSLTSGFDILMVSAAGGTINPGDTFDIGGHARLYRYTGTTPLTLNPGNTTLVTVEPFVAEPLFFNQPVSVRRGVAHNNGTFEVLSSQSALSGGTSVRLVNRDVPNWPFFAVAPFTSVSIFQEQPAFGESQASRVSFLFGDSEQEPDAMIVSAEANNVGGAENVYAARGRTTVWIEDLELTDFGNREPLFEAVVEERPETDAAGIIQDIAEEWLPEAQVDASACTGEIDGYNIRGPQDGKSVLQPLLLSTHNIARENAGVLEFVDRNSIPRISIQAADLAVTTPGGNTPRPVEIEDISDSTLPDEINVRHISEDRDFQTASKRARASTPNTLETQIVDLPIVLQDDQAQRLADTLLALTRNNRLTFRGTASIKWLPYIQEGRKLQLEQVHGQFYEVLVTRVDRGADLSLSFEARLEDRESFNQTATSEGSQAATVDSGAGTPAPSALWHAMDIPPLRDEDATQPGLYFAVANADPTIPAKGYSLYMSSDNGVSFGRKATIPEPAVFGWAVYEPDSSGRHHYTWDRATKLLVRLHDPSDSLESVTDEQCLAGRNRFCWGNEIIGAATCTQVGPGMYELSDMLRGLQDTDDQIQEHRIGDRVVWLDGPGIAFVPMNISSMDSTKGFKVVSHGGLLADASARFIELEGRSARPLRVAQIRATRNATTNDLTIEWNRKTRKVTQFLDQAEPLLEDVEEYQVEILDGGAGPTLRTWTTTVPFVVYRYGEQLTDGFEPPTTVYVRVTQKSRGAWFGRPHEALVPQGEI